MNAADSIPCEIKHIKHIITNFVIATFSSEIFDICFSLLFDYYCISAWKIGH